MLDVTDLRRNEISLGGGSVHLIDYTLLDDNELRMVLSWRNHDSVRRYLINKEEISWGDHVEFVKKLINNDSSFYWLARLRGKPCGVVSLRLDPKDHSYGMSGIFMSPDRQGTGDGVELAFHATHFFFEQMRVHTLRNDVYKNNKSAVKLNRAMGYDFYDNPSDNELYLIILSTSGYNNLPKDFDQFISLLAIKG